MKFPKKLKGALSGAVLALLTGIVLIWIIDFRMESRSYQQNQLDTSVSGQVTGANSRQTTPSASSDPSIRALVVQIDGLNLRAGPSRATRSLRVLPKNTQLVLLGTDAGWHHVELPDGAKGYVIADEEYVTTK